MRKLEVHKKLGDDRTRTATGPEVIPYHMTHHEQQNRGADAADA